ncbi:MAG TPA: hypothetical protein ACFCUY_11080 [Xenococcaceae cyanobacterium]
MINCGIKILLLTAVSLTGIKFYGISRTARASHDEPKNPVLTNYQVNLTSSQVSDQARRICQRLGQGYEEVHSFLTYNFYIGICRQGDRFYYFRQSKSNPEQTIILRATTVFGGEVFKAVKGRVTYFVGVNANGYYSSVMQPNHEIIVEPEVKSETFNVNHESSETTSNVFPILSEPSQLNQLFCDREEKASSLTSDYEISFIENSSLFKLIENNFALESKDAILYSSFCT